MALPVATSLGGNSASGSTVTLTGLTYAVGDEVVVGGWHDGAAVGTPVTDSLGNSFPPVTSAVTTGGVISRVFKSKITTGGTGITLTLTSNTGDLSIAAAKVSGLDTGTSLDTTTQGTDASSPYGDALGVTPTTAEGIAFTLCQGGSNNTNPATHSNSGWTITSEQATGGPQWVGAMAYKTYSSIAAQVPAWTELGAGTCAVHTIALKAAPSGSFISRMAAQGAG